GARGGGFRRSQERLYARALGRRLQPGDGARGRGRAVKRTLAVDADLSAFSERIEVKWSKRERGLGLYPPPCGEGRPPKRSGGGRGGGVRGSADGPPPPTPPQPAAGLPASGKS